LEFLFQGDRIAHGVVARRLAGAMRIEFKETPEIALPAVAIERWLRVRKKSKKKGKGGKTKPLSRKKRKAAARKGMNMNMCIL